MRNDIEEIVVSEEQIAARVKELAAQISEDYRGKDLTVVCILKGSVLFFSDLCKYIDIPLVMDFMAASSYGNATSTSGQLKIKKDLSESVEGKNILLVEDIIDSGYTLTCLKQMIADRGAASVRIATLLDKPSGRRPGITLESDYVGFTIKGGFVVGYGLDYAEKYRNLRYVGILKREVYEK